MSDSLIRSRFGAGSTATDVAAGRDLGGKTILVTGGASGLGLETSRALAGAGADLFVAVRDPGAARAAVEDLGGRVTVLPLDLTDAASIAACAGAFLDARPRLDVLICNAGISYTPQSHLPNGWELRFATNHLGHFQLFRALQGALEAAAPARVVMVSSAAHKYSPVELDDVHFRRRPFDPFKAYGQSKSANIMFAVELSARHAGRGITANALSPGSSLTRLQRYVASERMIQNGLLDADGQPVSELRTIAQGASTSVWAAIDPALEGVGGLYLEDCAEAAPFVEGVTHKWYGYGPHARDPERAAALWALTEAMLAEG